MAIALFIRKISVTSLKLLTANLPKRATKPAVGKTKKTGIPRTQMIRLPLGSRKQRNNGLRIFIGRLMSFSKSMMLIAKSKTQS